MEFQQIRVTPLSRVIGAEVSGVDLTQPLDDATLDELKAAWAGHLVLFVRDQNLTFEQHKALGRCFGELHIHPAAPKDAAHPEILAVHGDDKVDFVAGSLWHSDVSCDVAPPMASILRIEQIPSSGGDTLFASMYAAFEGLSDRMQRLLSGLTAVHEGEQYYRGRYGGSNLRDGGYPSAEHPVVRTHPVTGRQALYVNEGFTTRIKELPLGESDALLAFLFKHCANTRLSLPVPVARALGRVVGQPLHAASRHLGLLSGDAPRLPRDDQRRPAVPRPERDDEYWVARSDPVTSKAATTDEH